MLKKGDKIGIVACSNGQPISNKIYMDALAEVLVSLGLSPTFSDCIYADKNVFNGTPEEKASSFMALYKNPEIKAIFDISGGDLANEVLDYLDYDYISKYPKPFFGYSDLTTVVNSLNSMCGIETYLYQIRNLIYSHKDVQQADFVNSLFNNKDDLFNFSYEFIQGRRIEGPVVGGNIRCLLKLAGTKYMPDFTDKVLFLESHGGDAALMSSFLNQLKQIGVFNKVKGLILGTFTKMEENKVSPTIEELVLRIVGNPDMPIAKTYEIGHGQDSKCIVIGKNITLE